MNTKPKKWGWLLLFTTTGTLLCCALPILLVVLGMGSVVASVVSNFPILIFLSLHKIWVFAVSGILLVIAGWFLLRPGRFCPTDPELAKLCESAFNFNKVLFWISVAIWTIGFFFAFVIIHLT